MTIDELSHILYYVQQPSRYLGLEPNRVVKPQGEFDLHMVLAFPDLYEIGMSHFGIQILYNVLNSHDRIYAERVFAPDTDMGHRLAAEKIPLFTLETRTPLKETDIVGFSLLYELNYTNILWMLDLAGIPFFSKERDDDLPLIIAGGPCTVNPEPVAPFFDAMVIGDGESVIISMAEAAMDWKKEGSKGKERLLAKWAGIEGVYVPAIHDEQAGHGKGFAVKRAVVPDLNSAPFPETPVVPFGRPVHDRLRLEIARGCSRGCRFCQAGMIYRPVRERSMEKICDLAERAIRSTGYRDISLLSLSSGDYSCIFPLISTLVERFQNNMTSVSLPSFRAGTLDAATMERIRSIRKTGFTIAPEAGSQRLRSVINKRITEEEIVQTVSDAFSLGWRLVKLYFMIGLPTETDEDLDAIASLVRTLNRHVKKSKKRPGFNVSVATFIPKSHTPFQWAAQIGPDEAWQKIERLKSLISPGIASVKWNRPEVSLLEGLFARGDRRLSDLLVAAYRQGCIFDGWSDKFDLAGWNRAFDRAGVDPCKYVGRRLEFDEKLPWDHVDVRISKEFLQKEARRAETGTETPDCRSGGCTGCGACDFIETKPVYASGVDTDALNSIDGTSGDRIHRQVEIRQAEFAESALPAWQDFFLLYSKSGEAAYLGQLELSEILVRSLMRCKARFKFSSGFHPKPRISFFDALPLGIESEAEQCVITLDSKTDTKELVSCMNLILPPGIRVILCHRLIGKKAIRNTKTELYRIINKARPFDKSCYEEFCKAEAFPVVRRSSKGVEKKIDLKDVIDHISFMTDHEIILCLKRGPQGEVVRPLIILRSLFGIKDNERHLLRIIKCRGDNITDSAAGGEECTRS